MKWFLLLCLAAAGCPTTGTDDDNDDNRTPGTAGTFGVTTSAVVLVNPVINAGSTTSVTTGSQRANIEVRAGSQPVQRTNNSGIALLADLPTGQVPIEFDSGSVTLTVQQAREMYDVVVTYDASGVQHIFPPVRYPIGGNVVVLDPGESIADAADDNAIILLNEGTYAGDVELRAENVLIFGAWSAEEGALAVIDGDVTVLGGGNRIRGVRITGTLTSNANGFSAAFCELERATILGNGVTLIANQFTGGQATVPSGNAVLVDNIGIP